MTATLQVGLIGYGLAGSVFHAPLLQHTPGLALHSIVSSQRDRLLRTFTDVHVHAAVEPLLADPAIDAVVIATPTNSMRRSRLPRCRPASMYWWTSHSHWT